MTGDVLGDDVAPVTLGDPDGAFVGAFDVGVPVGAFDVGVFVGPSVACTVGEPVGKLVGRFVGSFVGEEVGDLVSPNTVGAGTGFFVGDFVGVLDVGEEVVGELVVVGDEVSSANVGEDVSYSDSVGEVDGPELVDGVGFKVVT